MSRKSESRANCLAKLEFLSYSAPAIMTFQLPCMLHMGWTIPFDGSINLCVGAWTRTIFIKILDRLWYMSQCGSLGEAFKRLIEKSSTSKMN